MREFEGSNVGMMTMDGEHWYYPELNARKPYIKEDGELYMMDANGDETKVSDILPAFQGRFEAEKYLKERTAGTWEPFTKRRSNMFGIKIQLMSTYKRNMLGLQDHKEYIKKMRNEVGELKRFIRGCEQDKITEDIEDKHSLDINHALVTSLKEEIERLNLIINPLPVMKFDIITKDGQELSGKGDELMEDDNGDYVVMLKGEPVLVLGDKPSVCKISPWEKK